MSDYQVQEINVLDNDVTFRSMSNSEIENTQLAAQQAEQQKAREEEEKAAKETARAEILAKLGLTAEEAQILLL